MDPAPIEKLHVSCHRVPTDFPEADGTIEWDATTLVVVEVEAAGERGLGFTYGSRACGELLAGPLAREVEGRDVFELPSLNEALWRRVRNLGRPGVSAMAISAMDVALWDCKAKVLGVSLPDLWGKARGGTPVYGSGGFTSYPVDRLKHQLASWVEKGIGAVKMKVGADPPRDLSRVEAAREAIGGAELFVDANGAYERKQALAFAEAYASLGVSWFEEPVSSDDREGLRLLRDRIPPGMRIAAGEYAFTIRDFLDLLQGGCVDVLQADLSRCGGFSGFLQAATLAKAFHVPLSAHTSPSLHALVGCAVSNLENIEYFHDHARIEDMLFDGLPLLRDGALEPIPGAKGHGLVFKREDASRYLI